MMEFTVKEVSVFRVATFFNEALRQIYFLRNLRNIQHNDHYKSGLPNAISIRFRHRILSKFRHSVSTSIITAFLVYMKLMYFIGRNCCGKKMLRGKSRNFRNFFFRNNIIFHNSQLLLPQLIL